MERIGLSVERFAQRFPKLFHVTQEGAWPCIEGHGLLSSSALVDLAGLPNTSRNRLLCQKRNNSETIILPDGCHVTIRDQKPLVAVEECVKPGTTSAEFLRLLSEKVFFWLSEQNVNGLLQAGPYRQRNHCVLVLETESLLADYAPKTTLTSFNTGNSRRRPVLRDYHSFIPLECWDRRLSAIVELAIDHRVRDVRKHVLSVEHRKAGEAPTIIYTRP